MNRYQAELYHYGIKGMKKGVRRGPPYPLNKNKVTIKAKNAIIEMALKSGKVSKKVNPQKQGRHIKNSPDYVKGRSYIHGSFSTAQKLIDELSGTGSPIIDKNGNWTKKERVTAAKVIGTHVSNKTGIETPTSNALIVYSKTGSHIIPGR